MSAERKGGLVIKRLSWGLIRGTEHCAFVNTQPKSILCPIRPVTGWMTAVDPDPASKPSSYGLQMIPLFGI